MVSSEFFRVGQIPDLVLADLLPMQGMDGVSSKDEYPPKAQLRQLVAQAPLPVLAPGTVDPASTGDSEPLETATLLLEEFNAALAADDVEKLKACFFPEQAFWRDQLALTYHIRTFTTLSVAAAALLETKKLRGLDKGLKLKGTPQFVPATPVLVSQKAPASRLRDQVRR